MNIAKGLKKVLFETQHRKQVRLSAIDVSLQERLQLNSKHFKQNAYSPEFTFEKTLKKKCNITSRLDVMKKGFV